MDGTSGTFSTSVSIGTVFTVGGQIGLSSAFLAQVTILEVTVSLLTFGTSGTWGGEGSSYILRSRATGNGIGIVISTDINIQVFSEGTFSTRGIAHNTDVRGGSSLVSLCGITISTSDSSSRGSL